MSTLNGVVIRTHTNADIALRMDARSCPDHSVGVGCGVVNCQYNPGPWEQFNIEDQGDGTVAIGSVAFKGFYLRMDGNIGVVNCQYTAGPWEKYKLVPQSDGSTAIESVQFPNHFLNIDTEGVTGPNPNGWNTVSCKAGISENAKFELMEPEGGFKISDLALSYNTFWSPKYPKIFMSASMTITNNTGKAFPIKDQSSWVSLDVYANTKNNSLENMQKIGEVPANLGNLTTGGSIQFSPSDWEENGLAKMVTQNPAFPTSGQYYIYIQVRNTEGTIDGKGAYSTVTYQLPPVVK